ncbi:MAG: GAF domain-containing SpoIIE family protein phosphatase [Candidatus Promineifilaceae bacterium]|nr:GAF domain-containing SpoIIE family protein phosphatase [Candidatus Promineifilaceae bacterium]
MTDPNSEQQIADLTTLNEIALALNRAADVSTALNEALAQLVELMGLNAGWIFLRDRDNHDRWSGVGYRLAAHYNLPPALELGSADAWHGGCDCQGYCNKGKLTEAYNEVRCSRLEGASGDRQGLQVHASAPLKASGWTLGILNVAAPDWDSFDQRSLALLTNVGAQMGIALERARLFDMLHEQRIHEQAALLDFSNQLLRRLNLDEVMDYLVLAVTELAQVDAAALSLLDDGSGELSFRAVAGWRSSPVAEGRRVPADDRSSSGWVVRHQRPVTINRARTDQAIPVWTADWLEAENFQAAAFVPLVVEGKSIGTLGVHMREPYEFDADQLRFLELMANQAAIAMEKARLHHEELARHRLEEDLAVGQRIQLSLLPREIPSLPGWQFCDYYQAARQVGGDFYDFFHLPGLAGRLGLVIADVSDKGVPAALFMAVSRTLIRVSAMSDLSPAQALEQTNRLLHEDSHSDLFLSSFYAILDLNSGQLQFTCAGHNPPLWYRTEKQSFIELNTEGIVLGVLSEIELGEDTVDIVSGDVLVLYTDGVTEAMNADKDEFGLERLRRIIAKTADRSARAIRDAIVEEVKAFTEDVAQSDDLTLVIIKRE